MLSTDEFAEYAKGIVLFLHVTTRVPGAKGDDLLLERGGTGFPTLYWLDADGDVTAKHEGDRSTKGFQKSQAGLAEAPMRKMKAKAASSDAANADYLIAQLEKGWMGHAQAAERVAKIAKLAPDKKKRLDELMLDREVLVRSATSRTDEQVIATATRFLELAEAKRVPAEEKRRVQFWGVVFKGLKLSKDPAKLGKAIAEARKSLGTDSKSRNLLEKAEEELAELKKQKPTG